MQQKLVSVIIPTYNRAHIVAEAIRSVKAQSYSPVQIIVIDDGSEDTTAEEIAGFENVEYHRQENKGQAAARNLGLSHARGEYIATLDSDDIWHEDFLKVAVAALEGFQADFVFLNWTEIYGTEETANYWEKSRICQKYHKQEGEWKLLNAKEVRRIFFYTCPAPSSALLIRRSSFVSTWNEEMIIADDWCLILEMVTTKPCRAAFTLSKFWTKHIHGSNIFDGRDRLEVIKHLGLHDEPLIAERLQKHLSKTEKAIMQKRLAGHYFNFGYLNLKHNGFAVEHLKSIATAFKLAPLGSVLYMIHQTFLFLMNRFRIAQNKSEQFIEVNKTN